MVPNCVIFALYVLGTLCNLPWKYLKSVEILFLKNLNQIVVITVTLTIVLNHKKSREIIKNYGQKVQVKIRIVAGAREQIKNISKIRLSIF